MTQDGARKGNIAVATALRHFNTYDWTNVTSDHPLYYLQDVFVGQILGEDNGRDEGVATESFAATMQRLGEKTIGKFICIGF